MFAKQRNLGMIGRRQGLTARAVRHAVASILLLASMVPFGAAALMQGRAASKAIVLDGQENFRSFRTASSEAGR